MRDAQDLRLKPIKEGNACPVGEDLYHWQGNFVVTLKLDGQKEPEEVVCHFHIELPKDYPQTAPNVGFCADFSYWNGAYETERKDGPLKGMKKICMNILGNYNDAHQDWERDVGAGWTPSMTIKSLIIQIQADFQHHIAK